MNLKEDAREKSNFPLYLPAGDTAGGLKDLIFS
jgi:hypothetical protein